MKEDQGLKQHPVALVTGASGGFGIRIAAALAGAGYIVSAGMRDTNKKQLLLKEISKIRNGNPCIVDVIPLDVTDTEACRKAVQRTVSTYGRLDVLVNNAGIAVGGFTEEVEDADWRKQMDTNLHGVITMAKAAIPFMRERGCGKIINISSISGSYGIPGLAPYCTSKFAVEGFSEALRYELLLHGIYVVLVEPGAYATNIWGKGLEPLEKEESGSGSGPYSEMKAALIKRVRAAADQAGDPQKVARLVRSIALHPKPKLRYPVGRGIRTLQYAKALIPATLREHLILRSLRNHSWR